NRTKLEAEPEAPEAIAPTPVAAEPATASTAPAPASVAETQPSAPPLQVPAIVRRTAPVEYLIQPVGPLATNVYVFADPVTRDAIAIDTAKPCVEWLSGQLEARGWRLRLIVSTHGHWDHIGDNAAVHEWAARQAETATDTATANELNPARVSAAVIAVHPLDREMLESPQPTFAPFEIPPSVPAVELRDHMMIRTGSIEFEILHTPGHTPGSVCLYSDR